YSFAHPTGADVGSTTASSLILASNAVYTDVLTVMLNGDNSEAITNCVYDGSSATGTPLTQFGGVATNSIFLTDGFNAIGFGWYQKKNTYSNQVDISSITVSGYVTPVTAPPAITSEPVTTYVATNGSCAFYVAAQGFNVKYQWRRDGTNLVDGGNISGAESDTLVISPATTADELSPADGYSVIVTGAGDYSTNSVTNALVLIPSTNLVWTAGQGSGWDVNDPVFGLNWENTNSVASVFNYGDPVTFNDVGGGGFVNLSNNYLSAASVTVSGGSFYVFQGPGSIAGPGPLNYIGSGRLTLDANNTYSGGTLISNATAYVLLDTYSGLGVGPVTFGLAGGQMEIAPAGTASSGIAGNVNIADDFTILADNDSSFGAVFLGDLSGTAGKTLSFVAGPGNPDTNIFRIRAYGDATVCDANLDLAANALFAAYSSSGSQTYNGVISDAGAFMEKGTVTYLDGANTYSGGTTPAQGSIGLGISSVGSPGSVSSGPIGTGPLLLAPDSTTSVTGNGQIFASAPDITVGNAIQYPTGTNNLTLEIGGANNLTLSGPFTLQGNDGVTSGKFTSRTLEVTNSALTTISGVISDGGLNYGLNISGSGVLALSATETYTGPTAITNATVLVNGQIGSGAVTVANNGGLGGDGVITGPVSINDGTLTPGNQAIGTLTINNSLTLGAASTNRIAVNGAAQTESEVVANSVAYGGTLIATNLAGSLSVGDTFTIYQAGSESGNFSAVQGTPGPGLAWQFNPASGVLS
ncbi:MAG: beta strand repeat-containing protein, partial [Limisphaerales bacterium]